MKDLWKNGVLLLIVIGVLYVLYLRECKHPLPCPPKGQVMIPQSSWDSILALANKPPVVTIDTVYVEKPVIIPNPQPPIPPAQPVDSTTNFYQDSLIKKDIKVFYSFNVKGTLLNRTWSYKPIQTVITIDSLIYVPYPVEIEKPVEVRKNGLYAYGIAGGNTNSFLFGGGVDFITKKDTEIGYQYQRFGNMNFHSIKFGGKIKF
jgi:hypothetical protein